MDKEATKLQSQLAEPNSAEIIPAPVISIQNINKEEQEKRKLTIIEKDAQEVLETDLSCAICQDIYINPLVLNCSHSFCKFCIYSWLSKHKRCPQCRMAVCFQAENLALRNVVDKMILKSSEQFQKTRRTSVEQRLKNEEDQSRTDRPVFLKNFARSSSNSWDDLDSDSQFHFTNWYISFDDSSGESSARVARARELFSRILEPVHDNNDGSEDTEDWEDYFDDANVSEEDEDLEEDEDDDPDDYDNPNRDETFDLEDEELSEASESSIDESDNDILEHEALEDSSDLEIIGELESDSDTTEIDYGGQEGTDEDRWYYQNNGNSSSDDSDMETLPYSDDSTIEYATSSSSEE